MLKNIQIKNIMRMLKGKGRNKMNKKKCLLIVLLIFSMVLFVSCSDDTDKEGVKATNTPPAEITSEPTKAPTPEPTEVPAEGVNVALFKDYEVSSTTTNNKGWNPDSINDGEIEAVTGLHMGWTSQVDVNYDQETAREWVIINLEKEYNITLVKIWPRQDDAMPGGYFPIDWQIDLSNDNENWTSVYEMKDDDGAENLDPSPRIIELEDAKGQYIRFMGTKLTDVHSINNNGFLMQVAEMEVFSRDGIGE